MKKVFANLKMSFAALLLAGGFMLLSFGANAQTQLEQNPTTPAVKGASGWLTESEALELLEEQLQGPIAEALVNLPTGGQQYIVWKHKAMLYEGVYAGIKTGSQTAYAFRNSYDALAGGPSAEPIAFSPLSQAEWQQLYNEMVDLLTQ